MDRTNTTQEERIFEEARARSTPDERCAFLDGACGNDARLRDRIEALLRADEEAGSFMSATADLAPREEGLPEALDRPGMMIGPYKLLQQIGEGGFGLVYMAEQQEPVRRKVALKIIKHGMDTRQVIARFEAERQALAMMDHTNIARVLDAGATPPDSGSRPYFVMELVKGVPITEYCDQHHLSTRARLALFRQVCHAVQHAHQKGIIHRDLKPSNVLVTLYDGEPVPKVIDFGVAKATHSRLTEKTLFTEFRQFIGTPEYMSPEQAEMSGLDIDTRADIYSLGVLLYELLTGTTPFDPKTLRSTGYGEIQRIIREVEPPKPSARLNTLAGPSHTPNKNGQSASRESKPNHSNALTIDELARRRNVEPRQLQRQLKGELDWIVMKAIEKDRTRRYETASALAEDIDRYLEGMPIEAGAPSRMYRLAKFARRNKVLIGTSAAVAALLVFGLVFITYSLFQVNQARQDALAAHGRLEEMSEYQRQMLAATDPAQAEIMNITVDEVLARSRELFGDDHAVIGAILSSRTVSLINAGDLEEAFIAAQEALAAFEQAYGSSHPAVGGAWRTLGQVRMDQGQFVEAADALHRAVDILTATVGMDSTAMANTFRELFDVLIVHEEDVQRTIHYGERMLESHRMAYGPEHRSTVRQHLRFGRWLHAKGFSEQAVAYLTPVIDLARTMFDEQDQDVTMALNALTVYYAYEVEDVERARPVYAETISRIIAIHGETNMMTTPVRGQYAEWLAGIGDYETSLDVLIHLLETVGKALSPEDVQRVDLHHQIARMVRRNPKSTDEQRRRVWRALINAHRDSVGADHHDTARSMLLAAEAFQEAGMGVDAIEQLRDASVVLQTSGNDPLRLAETLLSLGRLLLEQDNDSEAADVLVEAWTIRKDNLPEGHRHVAQAASMYGEALTNIGKFEEAEEYLLRAFGHMMGNPAAGATEPRDTIDRLVRLYQAWGRPLQAARWQRQLEPKRVGE